MKNAYLRIYNNAMYHKTKHRIHETQLYYVPLKENADINIMFISFLFVKWFQNSYYIYISETCHMLLWKGSL